jgi:glycosyltransferase involved in cell wall biosynthesis
MLNILRAMDGVLPQTRQLQTMLINWGCANTYYVPGCRPPVTAPQAHREHSEKLRLIFLSQIKPEKGVLLLLEALQLLAQAGHQEITCDFYGPIYEDSQEQFFKALAATPGAHYHGVAEAGAASGLISNYDALVLPTYFISEGHPGVIIEAMQAGIPVITTYHRAIPELITHGENGFLVPVRDSQALAEAIKQLARDRPLRQQMSQANYKRAQAFRADVVVPQILQIVFPTNFIIKERFQ